MCEPLFKGHERFECFEIQSTRIHLPWSLIFKLILVSTRNTYNVHLVTHINLTEQFRLDWSTLASTYFVGFFTFQVENTSWITSRRIQVVLAPKLKRKLVSVMYTALKQTKIHHFTTFQIQICRVIKQPHPLFTQPDLECVKQYPSRVWQQFSRADIEKE